MLISSRVRLSIYTQPAQSAEFDYCYNFNLNSVYIVHSTNSILLFVKRLYFENVHKVVCSLAATVMS